MHFQAEFKKKQQHKTKQNKTKTRETTHDIYTAMWMLHEQFLSL